ncbi:hypothetical protein LWI28_011198 [Acer negundo]|uniref:Ubiquinone biosynthesis protein n=1 Tax=Acer negundo TaxID=4023 RepID=A0AAD5J9N8_ACENE|nr:hypothetical protein LWI28_011198 [Acer negundo]
MYRTAAKRLLYGGTLAHNGTARTGLLPNLRRIISSHRFSTSSENPVLVPDQQLQQPLIVNPPEAPQFSDATSSSSSSTAEEARRFKRQRPRVEYQDEQARVLEASLRHVVNLGWTEAAMIAGAREVGLSPSIVGSFPRKEAALVEFFMDDCLQKLIDRIDSGEDLQNLIPSQCISKLVRIRLEMQAPYISKWPQALSIQAQPLNVSTSFKQRAMLVDEIWHTAGDEGSDIDWYVKRTILGGIYSTTEIYMLTDSSPDFHDTWTFLDARVKDAFDMKNTIQEAKYLVEAVGAGMGSSLQGLVETRGNSKMVKATEIAAKLNLKPHPEGGFYSETFRDTSVLLSKSQLPSQYKVDRPISTCIYFLLPSGSVSRLHRIPCAETWHFYVGEPITVIELNDEDGQIKLTCLGNDLVESNQQPQYTVPPNVWFGSFPTKDFNISPEGSVSKVEPRDAESHYSLVGCTWAPAFQFEDFELAKRSELVSLFPNHESLISLLTFPE